MDDKFSVLGLNKFMFASIPFIFSRNFLISTAAAPAVFLNSEIFVSGLEIDANDIFGIYIRD